MESINWPEAGLFSIIVGAGMCCFYLFLKTYITQKGKNYADKRDISDLTTRVEEVKSQYSKTLAFVNANLSLASKGIETYESEQFKSYINFHQACAYILNDVSNIDVGSFKIKLDFPIAVENKLDMIKQSFPPLRRAKANHDLFNDSEQIKENSDRLYAACFKYGNTLYELLISFSILQNTRVHLKQLKNEMGAQVPTEQEVDLESLDRESRREVLKAKDDVVQYVTGSDFQEALTRNAEYEGLLRKYLKVDRLKRLGAEI